jgi:potassium-transporting ATPase KdpC subunit
MTNDILRNLRPAIVLFIAFTVLTGVVYPLVVSAVGWTMFPTESGGNLIIRDGKVIGSRLIGQAFDDARYFWSRPSATGPYPYNGGASSGSNLGPLNAVLIDGVTARVDTLRASHPTQPGAVPLDLVTASGSGLDPHISPEAAYYQVDRVAEARGLPTDTVRELVARHVEPRTLGVLGEPRVNVLLLNLALDDQALDDQPTTGQPRAQ